MANDPKKTTSGTTNTNKPEPTPGTAEKTTAESTSASSAGTPGGNAGTRPPSSGPSATNASTARPITSNPAYGDPTVDRLSLEPADSDDWVTRTKLWVEENPALAVVGAIGLGLLVGRIVTAAIPDPEPKTLTDKIEKRARELSKQGRYYADDAGDAIAQQLAVAADALGEAANVVSKNAKHGLDEAKDFSEHIADAIGEAFSKKANDWIKRVS